MNDSLEIRHVYKTFGQTEVLKDIDVSINEGSFTCILGPSGSGKTTLLMILAGLEHPTQGEIFYHGENLTDLALEKRRVGIVFQHYALFPNLTVKENILFGVSPQLSSKEKDEKLTRLLDLTHLNGLENRYPAELSGGQQQRVAIARALAINPRFLLLDEPLSALDPANRSRIGRELREIQKKAGITCIMVTHDRTEALALSDYLIVLNHGRIEQAGTPGEIFDRPASAFVATFAGGMNLFEIPAINEGRLTGIRFADIAVSHATEATLSIPFSFTAELLGKEFAGDFVTAHFLLNDFKTHLTALVPRTNPVADELTAGALYAVSLPRKRWCVWSK
mgnify:CR=1 FL=1